MIEFLIKGCENPNISYISDKVQSRLRSQKKYQLFTGNENSIVKSIDNFDYIEENVMNSGAFYG